ncbi:Fic family protein (plasmid) [Moraxella bovis]|uniref:Fic family protein n=1 Tax=Moraxella bovis TaxID=476 RepID=UPI0022271A5F|nr:Fic family protein [Moraxella bovis]UZA34041.1 Fic family protein [Moraxella bovis]UZA49958.1 Fic family protein [Moraxella bovis]
MNEHTPKNPIPYNQDKLLYKPIFSQEELFYLEALNYYSKSEYLMSPRNIEAFSIEFAYTSAVLEGNTYNAIETEILLKTGRTSGSQKKFEEALMLKNMHRSFDYLVNEVIQGGKENQRPFTYLLKNAHYQASEMMLDKNECGSVRKEPVFIGMCSYVPSSIPAQLETGLEIINNEYNNIQNPFEKAVYAHQNLAYLQYFSDHNKRTARNMCAYTLMLHDKMPVMFTERSVEEYARAVTHYYESEPADYTEFAKYFISSYERVCSRMNANAIVEAQNILKVMSSKNLNESYPMLSDNQILELKTNRDMILERYSAPKAQIIAFESLANQISDIEKSQELDQDKGKGGR